MLDFRSVEDVSPLFRIGGEFFDKDILEIVDQVGATYLPFDVPVPPNDIANLQQHRL